MKTPWSRSRKVPPKRRRGGAVVEAAMVLPIVLLFLLGILEYGRYVMTRQVLTNAAREGAHYALAHTEPVTIQGTTYGNANSDVTNIVDQFSAGQRLASQQIQVYKSDVNGNNLGAWTDAAAGELICVRISGTYNFVIPQLLYLPSSVPLVAQSVMRSEGN
jgi:Flp pilus assembly protein TadG